MEKEALDNWKCRLGVEQSVIKQKAVIKWTIDADENTCFFRNRIKDN